MNSIKLKKNSILHVPFDKYTNDFTFIVNGKRYETNKFVSDLLSAKIANIHQTDPTMSEYCINTKSSGDFKTILNLVNFEKKEIEGDEIPFILEIFDNLRIESIEIKITTPDLNNENFYDRLEVHDKYSIIYDQQLKEDIEFVSSHFYEILNTTDDLVEKFINLRESTVERIINNDNLVIETEDQLLKFINKICQQNSKYSYLYEYVYFNEVTSESIIEFLSIFDINTITPGTWKSLGERLSIEVDAKKNEGHHKSQRYRRGKEIKKPKVFKTIEYSNNETKGIFNFFRTQSSINDEISVTCSSISCGDPKSLLDMDNKQTFYTNDEQNPWICFEFKKHQIVLSNYSIKSKDYSPNSCHPKNWFIEGSNDKTNWHQIDEQKNCSYLNGNLLVHTFDVQNSKETSKSCLTEKSFKYIRIRHTGINWNGISQSLDLCAIEFYGDII